MLVYGKNVLKELCDQKTKISKIFVYKKFEDMSLINNIDTKIMYLEKNELDKMVDGVHQGVIMQIDDYKYYDIEELDSDKIVMLDHLEDPHNLGAIIRTCEAAGINSIVIPKDRSVLVNGTVMKTSVGTLNRVKISLVTNLSNTIDYLKKKGYWVVGTDMEGTNYKDIDYKGKIVLVIGNEGKGISKLIHDKCDFIASIPMKGEVNSLNASVAAGIIIFESIKYE